MSKKELEKEEEKKVTETEVMKESCDCEHDHCDCSCDCGDFEFDDMPIHKKCSFANIFSITCKVLAIIFFIIGTWNFISYTIQYVAEAAQYAEGAVDWIGLLCTYFTQILLIAIAFAGIGEGVNLLNRLKETLY